MEALATVFAEPTNWLKISPHISVGIEYRFVIPISLLVLVRLPTEERRLINKILCFIAEKYLETLWYCVVLLVISLIETKFFVFFRN
jgi:hypothetical protein